MNLSFAPHLEATREEWHASAETVLGKWLSLFKDGDTVVIHDTDNGSTDPTRWAILIAWNDVYGILYYDETNEKYDFTQDGYVDEWILGAHAQFAA